ncbi:MAG: hypothetical protein HY925_07665 [Elusimicrobia bacterium]|nr:hypothetical protein [Elusimicrobiota bacterium]
MSDSAKAEIQKTLKLGFESRLRERDLRAEADRLYKSGDSINAKDFLDQADAEAEVMRGLFIEAIRATQEAYGTKPSMPSGVIHGGPFDGQRAAWNPVVQLGNDVIIEREDPNKQLWHFRSEFPAAKDEYSKVGGHTFHSGDVRISIDVLAIAYDHQDPGVIALALYHESIHFDDLVSRGLRGNKEDLELRAYTKMRKHAADLIGTSPLQPNWKKLWMDSIKKERARNFEKIVRRDTNPILPTKEEDAALKEEFDTQEAALAQIRRQEEMLRESAEEQQRAREARARSLRAQPIAGADPTPRAQPVAAFDSVGALKNLAQRACWSPDGILEADIIRWFSWVPDGRNYFGLFPSDLDHCSSQLLNEILAMNTNSPGHAGLSADWLTRRAASLRSLSQSTPYPLIPSAPTPAISVAPPPPPRMTAPRRERDCDRFTWDGISWKEVGCP